MYRKPVIVLLCVFQLLISIGGAQTTQLRQPENVRFTFDRSSTLENKETLGVTPPASASSNIVVNTIVQVNGTSQNDMTDLDAPAAQHASASQILSSAGTFGDFSRYLQLFPGVTFNTDESNDILVRGGNPVENLYLVDGIEVPNINHIATEASTGGLVSMIDTTVLGDVDLRTGGYDASYEERLSSVVEIHTREIRDSERHSELDAGFVGAGGMTELPLADGGSVLMSAHRSLLNLFTNDIGLNGVPIYTNGLLSIHRKLAHNDELTMLGLGGIDSIDITPNISDRVETNTIQTQYRGWRATTGVRWQHTFSSNSFGSLTASDSEQHEVVNQQDQFFDHNIPGKGSPLDNVFTPVYSEVTHDGTTNIHADIDYLAFGAKLNVIAGGALHFYRINYDVLQPEGEQSVLSVDPTHTDADTFTANLITRGESSYAEATWHIIDRWSLSGGGRAEAFEYGRHHSITPRLNTVFLLTSHVGVNASFGEYAQMPSFIYLTSWPKNHELNPIQARHIVGGLDLSDSHGNKISINTYQKNYSNYPVSTEYPTLSLANMVDTLGQQFLWIPLTSRGTGVAHGVEVSGEAHFGSHIFAQANIAYARAKYAAMDGIMRPGNFDYPIIANCAGTYRSGKRYEVSWRYEYSTGRPYTPYLLAASAMQDRPIYDVSQINAQRGAAYSRLDLQIDRTFFLGSHQLIAYAGLENVFDRANLLGYYWTPRLGSQGGCIPDPSRCVSAQNQMSRFPNFGVRYAF